MSVREIAAVLARVSEIAEVLVQVFFWVASVPAILFPLFYLFRSPWRSTIFGKMMMAKASALGIIFVLSILFMVVPDFPGKYVLAALAYAYLAMAMWAQFIILLGVQHRARGGGRRGDDVARQTPAPADFRL